MIDIYINGQSLDLFADEVMAFDFAINNVAEIETRNGDSSNTFKVPMTKRNREILGYPDEISILSGEVSPYVKIDVQIYEDGYIIRKGYAEIVSCQDEFEFTIYSSNTSWFEAVKGKPLSDIDLSEYSHIYNVANVFDSRVRTDGYIYVPIDYGSFTTKTADSVNDMFLVDLKPSVFVHTIMKKIFYDAGYKLAGGFINSNLYKKLILPWVNKEFLNDVDHSERLFKATWSVNTPYPSATTVQPIPDYENFDGNLNNYDLSLGRYTADIPNDVVFSGSIKVSTTSVGQVALRVYRNGIFVSNDYEVILNVPNSNFVNWKMPDLQLQAGEYADLRLETGFNFQIVAGSYWQNEVLQNIIQSSTVDLSPNLPDMTQDDLIRTLVNQFSLLTYTDEFTKTVYFEWFGILYDNIGLGNFVDWSDKLDLSEAPLIEYKVGEYGRLNSFIYKEDSNDTGVESYNGESQVPFGGGQLVFDNETLDEEKEVFESEFAPTICHSAFTGGPGEKLYMPFIPKASGDSAEPRILILYGEADVSALSEGTLSTIFYAIRSWHKIPFAYFVKKELGNDSIDSFRYNLAFDLPSEDATGDGLLDAFYKPLKRCLEQPKLVKAKFRLKPKDILNLNFTYPVYVDYYKSYFYINSINEYTGGDESTENELLKL